MQNDIATFTRDSILEWYRINDPNTYLSKASRVMRASVSAWQGSHASYTKEDYFSRVEQEFEKSTYDLLFQKFLTSSKAYLDSFNLSEWYLFGSSKIGVYQTSQTLVSLKYYADISNYGLTNLQPVQVYYASMSYDFVMQERGKRHYELSNHLGDVLSISIPSPKSRRVKCM